MRVAPGHFAESRFGEDQSAGLFQFFDDKRIAIGIIVLEQHRSDRRRQAFDIGLIFDDHRDAVQRTHRSRGVVDAVELRRLVERLAVEGNNRIERRPVLVVGGDAIEVELHQSAAGKLPRLIRLLNIVDRRF